MPIRVIEISASQFCELLGIEPSQFIGVQANGTKIGILVEGEDMAQTSGSFPQVTKGGKKSGGKKKGC
jgi:hypothetical protein